VYKLGEKANLVPKFIKIEKDNICFCKQCKSSDVDPEVKADAAKASFLQSDAVTGATGDDSLDNARTLGDASADGASKAAAKEDDTEDREDCECNPIHRLTFSCSYKVEMCTFMAFAEKYRPFTN